MAVCEKGIELKWVHRARFSAQDKLSKRKKQETLQHLQH